MKYVYSITKDNRIIYIGATRSPKSRLNEHKKRFVIDITLTILHEPAPDWIHLKKQAILTHCSQHLQNKATTPPTLLFCAYKKRRRYTDARQNNKFMTKP